jgi:hypothetical protein
MAKLAPKDRWLKYLEERIKALKLSGKLEPLRKKGLAVVHRKKQYSVEEWWQSFQQRAKSPDYLKWYEECETIANEFDLAPWVITMMCLIKGYKPEKDVGFLAMERDWPRIRMVTESTNTQYLRGLSYEAHQLGLCVVQRVHGVETTLLNLDPITTSSAPGKLNKDGTFKIDVEIPVGYPPEAASQLQKEASRLARELARRMGHPIPQRLRASKLVAMSEVLEAEKGPLPRGRIYDIVDKIYPDGDLSKDQRRRNLTTSRRHKVRKRLLDPDDQAQDKIE